MGYYELEVGETQSLETALVEICSGTANVVDHDAWPEGVGLKSEDIPYKEIDIGQVIECKIVIPNEIGGFTVAPEGGIEHVQRLATADDPVEAYMARRRPDGLVEPLVVLLKYLDNQKRFDPPPEFLAEVDDDERARLLKLAEESYYTGWVYKGPMREDDAACINCPWEVLRLLSPIEELWADDEDREMAWRFRRL